MRETGGEFLFAKVSVPTPSLVSSNILNLPLQLADIRKFLYQLGYEAGAKYRTNAKVVSVDVAGKSVTLESGEVLTADVIIGADGRHGLCRELVLECQPAPQSTYTGVTMYKSVLVCHHNDDDWEPSDVFTFSALIPGDRIRADPELSKFLGSVVGSLDSPVAQRIFLTAVLQAQYVWFGNGCASMMFEAVSMN